MFYCGRLGHGTNDCMEVDGDSTPEKTFGPSLRVSPWKLFKDEEADMHDDKGEGKRTSVARKFFITKERDQECRKVDKELIDEVADFFHKVSLVHDEEASEISGAGGTESTSGYRDDDSRKVALIDTIGDGGDMGAADADGKECQVTFDMGGKGSDIQQGDDISGRISESNNETSRDLSRVEGPFSRAFVYGWPTRNMYKNHNC